MRLDTEYTGALKPRSHPLRLIADAFRAQSTSESATSEDDGLWDAIKKASLTLDAAESSSETALAEPIPIFSNVFSDETIRLFSLIPVDMSEKDKPTPSFILQSPISTGRPRSFSLPDTPLSPDQSDRGRPPPPRHAHVVPSLTVPSLTANNSTAPPTASPVTPTDWLQFSSNGFGTIPGSRDLAEKLWDNDVEVTVPPPAPLSRKSSRRAHSRHSRHSRHSSLDSARTPVAPMPTIPVIPISKTTLVAKFKLDEAFIDFWADSLLDPVSKHWPRFVLCQLKPLPLASTSASPTPAWLIIEQRLVRVEPVAPLVKEEAEITIPPARPRPSSPRPESSRLSSAFSIASKRFAFFTGGSSDPKSPKEKAAGLLQVSESGELTKERGGSATEAAEKPEEAAVKDSVNQDAISTPATVGAAVLAVASTTTPVVPAPAVSDVPIMEGSKSVELPAAERTPGPVRPAAAIEEHDVATAQVAESEPVVEVKAAEQDLPADEVAPDTEPTHTFEQVSAPAVEAVTVSEIPEVALPEGRAGELPTSDTAPVPSERADLEEDKTTTREVQVVTSADLEPVIVADSSATEFQLVSAAPAIQTSPVGKGQVADSVDAVKMTGPLEEPVEVVGEPVIKEDAQPAAIQRDDSILEEPKEMEATVMEPHPVASDTAFLAVKKADSATDRAVPEAPASNDESDVEHTVVVTQPIEDSLSTRVTPEMQDAIIEEQPRAEKINRIPEASISESISAGGPAASHDGETDTAPVESAVAEGKAFTTHVTKSPLTLILDTPAVEPTISSENPPPEELEEPVIEAASKSTTTARDAAHSPVDDPAEPVVDHAEQANAEATVLINGNESATGPTDEASTLKGLASVVAETQATNNESESVVAYEEPGPPEAKIPVETPAPTVHEAESLTEEPFPATTETLIPAPVSKAEEPVSDEATAPEVAETSLEAPVSVPAESDPVPKEATPTADAIADAVSGFEEPTPLLEEVEPVAAEAATDPTPLPDDPAPIAEAAVPETSVSDEPSPVVEEVDPIVEQDGPVLEESDPIVEQDDPVVEQDDPVVEQDDPVVAQDDPVVEQDDPVVEQVDPVVEQVDPVVEQDDPVVEQDEPVVEQDDPVVAQDDPVVAQDDPVVEQDDPVVEQDDPVIEEDCLIIEEDPPIAEEQPPVPEEHPPVVEEHPPVPEENTPIVEEQPPVLEGHPPVVEEPVIGEDPPVIEETPIIKEDDPIVEEDGPIVEEDEPAAPEPTVEDSPHLAEDLAPATESPAPSETPVESPEHDERLPTSEPAVAVAEETAPRTEEKAELEGTVEMDHVVEEESLRSEEQVAQELPSASGVDTETTGAADATSW